MVNLAGSGQVAREHPEHKGCERFYRKTTRRRCQSAEDLGRHHSRCVLSALTRAQPT